jgi:hypothetical protein
MAQLQQSVDIARPLEEVFAFVANPGNDARWGSNLVEVTQLSPSPLGWGQVPLPGPRCWPAVRAGARGDRVRAQPPPGGQDHLRAASVRRRSDLRGDPGRHPDHPIGGGRAGGFLGLAEPLLLRAAQRSLRTDLATLKRLPEGQTHAEPRHQPACRPG